MITFWLCLIILFVVLAAYTIYKKGNWLYVIVPIIVSVLLSFAIISIDYNIKTTDTEVWSGRVVNWDHKEEWDEWHDPVSTCTTDSNGNTSCTTTPGYWEHHYAVNRIMTSDNGWITVKVAPDGTQFNDNYPNDVEPLKHYWPLGTPTASSHTYENKVQASYSIYNHKDIDVKDYPDLPEYPSKESDYIRIDRILGDVPNKATALSTLAEVNAELNKSVPNPEKPGKTMSWKQVNIIFVNVGSNKPQEYGFALQDKWQGGNKNDFVVAFSLNENREVDWVYPFSWSEVEILKLEVRDYMLNLKMIDDFVPVVQEVGNMVADKFVRKQFADFNYLQIDISWGANLAILIVNLIILCTAVTSHFKYTVERDNCGWRRRY